MQTTATPAMNNAASGKTRKTQTPEQKIEALKAKQAQIDAQIKQQKAKLTAKKRKDDTRRKIVAGAIALEHMEHDENFRNVMEGLLKRHVKETDLPLFEI